MKIYFDDVLINQDYYKSISNDYTLFDDTFYLGSTSSNTFKITIDKRGVTSHPSSVVLKDNDNNALASLEIDNIVENDDGSYTYTLTDKMMKFEFGYDASIIINDSPNGKVSLLEILNDICIQAGVTNGISSLSNEVEVSWYDNTITAREYIGFIAELQASYAYIDNNGNLQFSIHKKESSKTISFDEIGDYKLGEYHKITRVVYEMGAVKYEYGVDTHDTLYINIDNPFITETSQVEYVYNQIKNFEFYSFETSQCVIDYSVKPGDIITFTDTINNYKTIAQYSLDYFGSWTGGYALNIKSKKQEITEYLGAEEKYKRIKIEVDRNKNTLNTVVEETRKISPLEIKQNNDYAELKSEFDNYATAQSVVEVKEAVELNHTNTEYSIGVIEQTLIDGVPKVSTEKGFTFNDDGLTIDETNSKVKNILDTIGMLVQDKSGSSLEELLFAGYDEFLRESIVRVMNILVRKYFNFGNEWRLEIGDDETYGKGLLFFKIGGDE